MKARSFRRFHLDVHSHRGLVEKQDIRLVQHGTGQLSAHALPKGHLPHRCVEEVPDAEDLAELGQAPLEVVVGNAVNPLEQLVGLPQTKVPVQLAALAEHGADALDDRPPLAWGERPTTETRPDVG